MKTWKTMKTSRSDRPLKSPVYPVKIMIPGRPITKKNSQQIFYNDKTGKRFISPSEKYKEWENTAGFFVACKWLNLSDRINIRCLFYMPSRRFPDLNNLLESVTDMLVHYGVIRDDNAHIVAGHDGSRVLYDKDYPRVEIQIEKMEE